MDDTATLFLPETPAGSAERRLRLIFEQAPIGIMLADASATLLEVNDMLCEILGYSSAELIGRRVHSFSHPDDLALTERVRQSMLNGVAVERYERRYVRKDGSSVWCAVRLTATRQADGSVDRIIALVEEIGERKKAEERVAYQARLLECVEQAVIATDLDGTIVYINRYAERLFGWRAAEAIGCNVTDITPSSMTRDQAKAIMARLADGEHWSGEFELTTRDGRTFPAQGTDSPVFDAAGRLIGVVGVSFEITSQKATEASLRRRIVEQAAVGELGQIALTSRDMETVTWRASMLVGEILGVDAVEVWRSHGAKSHRVALFDQRSGHGSGGESMAVDIPGSDGNPWGSLTVHLRERAQYGTDDAAFLRAVALLLGQCAERLRFESELRTRELQQSAIAELGRRSLSRIDDAILNRACELVRAGLGVEFAVFTPHGEDGGSLAAQTDGIRASVAVPVMSEGRTFGVLTAQTREERTFAAADVHFMQGLSTILAEAMARDAATAERDAAMHELQLLLESTAEGIYTTDADGICTLANRAAGRMLGVESADLIGKRLHDVMHHRRADGTPFDFEECPLSDVLRTGATHSERDDVFWRADGSAMPVEYIASPLIENGVVRGAVVTFTDITQQKQLASQLERATRLSSLGRLAATMAHEFNNVLMAISPFAEVLVRQDSDAAWRATAARHITGAVHRAKRITSDILRFTRPAEPALARIDVAGWLQAFASEVRSMIGVHALEIEMRDASLAICGDASQLHQVLLNLVINARDAMTSPGAITIGVCRELPSRQFDFGLVPQPERYIHISVADTGCGMTPESVRHLFEPLYTTKRNGTGIGLTVAHQVIVAHGGHIFVETELGVGTTFHLFIPRDESVKEAVETKASASTCRARTVLLVEDDPAVASGVAALLDLEGVSVQIVGTGAAVLPILEQMLPDAVLLDIGLPDMDGTAVYASIAERYPDLPVIFSSGHADATRLERHLSRRNVGFLMKPWEIDALVTVLDRVVA